MKLRTCTTTVVRAAICPSVGEMNVPDERGLKPVVKGWTVDEVVLAN